MNELIPAQAESLVSLHGDHPVTTSLIIAQAFGKQHKNVLRAIENIECSAQFSRLNFEPAPYIDSRGKPQRMYNITRDGFVFLAMGFTGPTAASWKEAYIDAFNRMDAQLKAGDARALNRALAELARTQRQLISAQRSLLAQARRQVRLLGGVPPAPDARQGELFQGRA